MSCKSTVEFWIEEAKNFNLSPIRKAVKVYGRSEKDLCLELAQIVGGRVEVPCPVGRIDVLSDEWLIEGKKASHYKHALGQLFCYKAFIERPLNALALIGDLPPYCLSICRAHNIYVFNYRSHDQQWNLYK